MCETASRRSRENGRWDLHEPGSTHLMRRATLSSVFYNPPTPSSIPTRLLLHTLSRPRLYPSLEPPAFSHERTHTTDHSHRSNHTSQRYNRPLNAAYEKQSFEVAVKQFIDRAHCSL
ncbi:hypothetical protein Tco_0772900 [Tanacetum coccineum]|uniref:Uncharacterized protein n=1 Tax=Tanacetum coccineum TaxID=301880 RepID=A0ABQ4ZJ74_9ASTR